MDISSNKLLPILGTLMVFITVAIGVKSCGNNYQEDIAVNTSHPKKNLRPDADSPADTLRSLTAQLADERLEAIRLRQSNEAAMKKMAALGVDISHQVKEDLRKEALEQRDSSLAAMMKRLDEMSARISAGTRSSIVAASSPAVAGVGENPDGNGSIAGDTFRVEPLNALSLIDKFGISVTGLKNQASELKPNGDGMLSGLGDNAVLNSHLPRTGTSVSATSALPEPVYTVPRNATLIGSTGMSALIGRIPFKGHVDDPYPFKVIVGSNNLAANGLEIPGVDGMIFTGDALGDWSLSCVRGSIHSVTFVFDDGTLRTLSSDDQSFQQKSRESAQAAGQANASISNTSRQALGWISDRRGIPCITGTRISNATQFLGGRFLARAIGAAGNAFARSQTSITTSPLTGGSTSAVTGDPSHYALGSLAAGSSDELAQWISDRQAQNYDAVFVDTGAEVALHIDRELPIDYEPHGRKLAYARKNHRPNTLATLD